MMRRLAAALLLALLAGMAARMPARAQAWSDLTLATLRGDAVQGGLLIGSTAPGTAVTLGGRPVALAPDGTFALGFDRDAGVRAELVIKDASGRTEQLLLEVRPREFDIQRIDGLPSEQVSPTDPALLERIGRERAAKAAAREWREPASHFAAPFIWPVVGILTGRFGSQRILNGEAKRPHYGLDIAGPVGTPVLAPAAGRVTLAEPDFHFEGGLVFLDHGLGVTSTFMHLSAVSVKAGEEVRQGQVLGALGATGRATGPHLHWGLSWGEANLDPELLVPAMPKRETPAPPEGAAPADGGAAPSGAEGAAQGADPLQGAPAAGRVPLPSRP